MLETYILKIDRDLSKDDFEEVIKPVDIKIAERFFSRDEYETLMSQPEEKRLKYFYMIWTLKESYIKAEGKGLSIPLNSFCIKIDCHNASGITDSGIMKYYFSKSFLDDKTVCGICTNDISHKTYTNLTSERIVRKLCS